MSSYICKWTVTLAWSDAMTHVINWLTLSKYIFCQKILCLDEWTFYLGACEINVLFYAKNNLLFAVEMGHSSPHVMLAGMTAIHLIGPCFFSRSVNTTSFTEGGGRCVPTTFGAPTHLTLTVRNFEQTFFMLLDWLWFTSISCIITLAIT